MLTEPSWLLGATRWPSSSTSVREGPKLRSDSVLPPLLVLPLPCVRGVRPPMMLGSLFSASAVSLGVVTRELGDVDRGERRRRIERCR